MHSVKCKSPWYLCRTNMSNGSISENRNNHSYMWRHLTVISVVSSLVLVYYQVDCFNQLNALKREVKYLRWRCEGQTGHISEKIKSPAKLRAVRVKRSAPELTTPKSVISDIPNDSTTEIDQLEARTLGQIAVKKHTKREVQSMLDSGTSENTNTVISRASATIIDEPKKCQCKREIDKAIRKSLKKKQSGSVHLFAEVDNDRLARQTLNDSTRVGRYIDGTFIPQGPILRFWAVTDFFDETLYRYETSTGIVKLKKKGIYLVYAQVVFHDNAARKSIGLYKNEDLVPIVESISFDILPRNKRDLGLFGGGQNVPIGRNKRHSNVYTQCDFITLVSVMKKDKLYIKSSEDDRGILPKKYLSYWGITKIN